MRTFAEEAAELRAKFARAPELDRLRLISFDEIELEDEPECLIEGLIPAKGLTVVWGPPKSRKSFIVADMLLHAALGWEYRGRRVLEGPAVYCAFEGASGFKKRLIAFKRKKINGHAKGPVPFHVLPVRINLVLEVDELVASIKAKLGDVKPLSITLDTLNRSLVGSESKDEDMSAYVAAADRLRQEFDCAVIIIHHCGVDGTRPRGHTSLTGAADAQLSVARNGEVSTLTLEYMKDGEEGSALSFSLEQVTIGQDRYGLEINSCVVVEADAPAGGSASGRKVTGPAKVALDLLQRAITEAGETPPGFDEIPPNTRAVRVSLWRRYCDTGQISETNTNDGKRMAFNRASSRLQELGKIGFWADWVWLT